MQHCFQGHKWIYPEKQEHFKSHSHSQGLSFPVYTKRNWPRGVFFKLQALIYLLVCCEIKLERNKLYWIKNRIYHIVRVNMVLWKFKLSKWLCRLCCKALFTVGDNEESLKASLPLNLEDSVLQNWNVAGPLHRLVCGGWDPLQQPIPISIVPQIKQREQ